MARKKHVDEGSSSEWLNTYADMVTLLLTFFVLLYSISTVNTEKAQMLIEAMNNIGLSTEEILQSDAPHGNGTGKVGNTGSAAGENASATASGQTIDVATLYEKIQSYINTQVSEEVKNNITVEGDEHFVFIRFTDDVFFNPDSAVLRNEGAGVLTDIGSVIKTAENAIGAIRIEGHTAAILENENYRVDDRELSSDRANAVLKFLEKSSNISSEILSSLGYGKYRPIADNSTPEGRKKNRRVEILIVDKNIDYNDKDSLKDLVSKIFGEDKYKVDSNYLP